MGISLITQMAQCNPKSPYERKRSKRVREENDMAEVEIRSDGISLLDERPEPRSKQHPEVRQGKKQILLWIL